MSDTLPDRVLAQALPEIPLTGFSDATLAAAAEKAGVSKRELQDGFPQGPASLVEAFSHWADRRMAELVAARETEPRIRDRIASAVRTRIEVLEPHKEAARRAAAFLAQPQHTAQAATLMMRTVDAMLRAAGDRSSDFSYYTKRATLAAVYGTTLAYWFSDSSEGHSATWTFLGHRIDNVMSIEKFRGQAKGALSKLPDPMKFFDSFRGGSGR
jgi:ubiquinone biosynthesis protein COQ9